MHKILLSVAATAAVVSSLTLGVCEEFGGIPEVDCHKGHILPTHVDGERIDYHGGKFWKNGEALAIKELKKSDKPQVAGAGGIGGPNSRLGHIYKNGVDWIYICRANQAEPNEYKNAFIGLIGFRQDTGETCFTDLVNGPAPHPVLPTQPSYCVGCHNNNNPWLITPYLNQKVVGGDGTMDIIPIVPRQKLATPGWGYRVFNLDEDVRKSYFAVQPKLPDGTADTTCTSCHVLSNGLRDDLFKEATGHAVSGVAKTLFGLKFPQRYWMPPGFEVQSAEEWEYEYRPAVKRYQYCKDHDDPAKCFPRQPVILPIK